MVRVTMHMRLRIACVGARRKSSSHSQSIRHNVNHWNLAYNKTWQDTSWRFDKFFLNVTNAFRRISRPYTLKTGHDLDHISLEHLRDGCESIEGDAYDQIWVQLAVSPNKKPSSGWLSLHHIPYICISGPKYTCRQCKAAQGRNSSIKFSPKRSLRKLYWSYLPWCSLLPLSRATVC